MMASGPRLQGHGRLTDREADAVRLLLDGRDTTGVADELAIAPDTARMHLASARAKSGAPNLATLVAWGYAHRTCCVSLPGYVSSDDAITEVDGLIHRVDDVLEQCVRPAILADRDGRYVFWNSAFRVLVGVDDGEIASRRVGEFCPASQREDVRRGASSLFNGDQLEMQFRVTFERPDGSRIPLATRARALSAGGRSNAFLAASAPVASGDNGAPAEDRSFAWEDLRADHASLTLREAEVVELLSAGLSLGEAAEARERSVETIRMHVRHAREKTQTRTLAALLAWWFRHAHCCRSGRTDSAATTDCEPATLIYKLGLALDSSGAATALIDLDGRPLIWNSQLGSVLRVTESEIESGELSSFVALDDRAYVQATMRNIRSLLLRDSRIRVSLDHRDSEPSIPIEIQLAVVGKGGKPQAYLMIVHALEPDPA